MNFGMDYFHSMSEPSDPVRKALLTVNSWDDLQNLGAIYEHLKKEGSIPGFVRATEDKKVQFTPVQMVAACMCLPTFNSPEPYRFIKNFVSSDSFSSIPHKNKLTCLLKLVRTAVQSRQVRDLLVSRLIHHMHDSEPASFQLPLLYLTAEAEDPWTPPVELTFDPRTDALTYYYCAINKLLEAKYDEAVVDADRAWGLSNHAKDIRPSLLPLMSITAFLAKYSYDDFCDQLPEKYTGWDEPYMYMWDSEEFAGTIPTFGLFMKFRKEIAREITRRTILDIAVAFKTITLSDIRTHCTGADSVLVLQQLRSDGEIDYDLVGDLVTFKLVKEEEATEEQIVHAIAKLSQEPETS
jgi:hypothetical protein